MSLLYLPNKTLHQYILTLNIFHEIYETHLPQLLFPKLPGRHLHQRENTSQRAKKAHAQNSTSSEVRDQVPLKTKNSQLFTLRRSLVRFEYITL